MREISFKWHTKNNCKECSNQLVQIKKIRNEKKPIWTKWQFFISEYENKFKKFCDFISRAFQKTKGSNWTPMSTILEYSILRMFEKY